MRVYSQQPLWQAQSIGISSSTSLVFSVRLFVFYWLCILVISFPRFLHFALKITFGILLKIKIFAGHFLGN